MGNPFSKGGCANLKGHARVSAVCFLPNGELVSAGDSTFRVWNPESGKCELVRKFTGAVETCCCSADGQCIACGVVDGLIFVFDARTLQQIAHWQAHAACGQGPALQFFSDSAYLLSAALCTCKMWASRTSQLINTWDTAPVTSLHISPDFACMAAGSHTGIVSVHSLPDGNAVRRVHAHAGEVWAVEFSPDGSVVATASRDEPDSVKVWDARTWELVQALRGHIGPVLDCAFSSDSAQLVTCGCDKTLRLWRRRIDRSLVSPGGSGQLAAAAAAPCAWRCENVLVGHSDIVTACCFAPSRPLLGGGGGSIVASGARDGLARAWRLEEVPQLTLADAVAHGVNPV